MQIENERPEDGLEEYVVDFFNTRVKETQSLFESMKVGNFDELKRKAHAWKGFSRPYGFYQLETLAFDLEDAAKTEDVSSCLQILEKVSEYLNLKKKYI